MLAAGALSGLLVRRGSTSRKRLALKRSFKRADKNGDGYLSLDEYVAVFREHGYHVTREEVEEFFNYRDRDNDGRISFRDFCGDSEDESVNERAFRALDLNNDGFVAKSEFEQVALSRHNRLDGKSLSHANLDATYEKFDRDRDDKLDYQEFCNMMNNRRNSTGGAVSDVTTNGANGGGGGGRSVSPSRHRSLHHGQQGGHNVFYNRERFV